MSRWGRLVVAGLWVLGGCSVPSLEELTSDRGASVAIHYTPSFKAGCIVMLAEDGANAANFVVQRFTGEELVRQRPPLEWRVVRREGWSSSAKVNITAYERACNEKEVDRKSLDVELSGKKYTVDLVTPDEDGDGYVAKNGDKGGTDCDDSGPNAAKMYPGNVELCDEVDNNCDAQVDEGFDKLWYADKDDDGAVSATDKLVQCAKPEKYIRLPQGKDFDCDDADKENTPGKPEVCDDKDNNCNRVVDDGIVGKGDACNNDVCFGTNVCNLTTKTLMCSALPPKWYYPDRDRDGDGDMSVAAQKLCAGEQVPANFVEDAHSDCDEADPSTNGKTTTTELCDAIDNNCNGAIDENVTCGGSLKRATDYHLYSANQNWTTVSTAPSGYPVWIAGPGGKLVLKRSAGAKFESFSFGDPVEPNPPDGSLPVHAKNCGNRDWTVSWVDSQGRVYLGGKGGWFTIHNGDRTFECEPGTMPARAGASSTPDITGIVGFEVGGQTHLYITDADGRLLRWTLGLPRETLHDLGAGLVRLHGVHGVREEFLLAAGGTVTGGSPANSMGRVRAYDVISGGAATLVSHSAVANDKDEFAKAVWMGADNKACAVGDNGAVWRWDGVTTWTRALAPQSNSSTDFTSVVMRYDKANAANPMNEQCYMVESGFTGRLRRWTPYGWARDVAMPSSATLPQRDIAMNATGSEFWIVGDDGRVFHYPEP